MASVALFNSQFLVNPLKQPQPAAAASNLSLLPPSGRRLRHRNHGAGTNHGAFRVRAAKPPAGLQGAPRVTGEMGWWCRK
ncbi:uncharacterized protein LOC110688999 isoform X2 [Chenopodium quinoa]|uniref:uncharacterized protein LOC110688999 isoform X2 n=1 Tax=Chenopodium quinoa TaxID=63459 RepID=UPI000B77E1C1|nr:uncharacterized protein LOC110688999 isoform X2 [Chenopodium quinoa]